MKGIYFLPLLFVLNAHSEAQTPVLDSIRQLVQSATTDTGKVIQLQALSFRLVYTNPDSALQLSQQGLALSRKQGYLKGEAYSYSGMGVAFGIVGNNARALECHLNVLKIFEKIKFEAGIPSALSNIGGVYAAMGDYRQALTYRLKAKEMLEKSNISDKTNIAQQYISIGDSYEKLNQLDSARIYTQHAYELGQQLHDDYLVSFSLNNLGNIYAKMQQPGLAMEYYKLSLDLYRKVLDAEGICDASMGIANVYLQAGKIDSALQYASESLAIANREGFTKYTMDAGKLVASLYAKKGSNDSAYYYLTVSMAAKEVLSNKENQKEVQNMLFNETIRQIDLSEAKVKAEEERNYYLQLFGVAAFIITFILFVLVIGRKKTKPRTIEFFGILGLLLVFEFINLAIHPFIEKITFHSPVLMLLVLVVLASILVPLHHKMEKIIKAKLAHKIVQSEPIADIKEERE